MTARLLYIWGDDDLLAQRLVARFGAALSTEAGLPLERWDLVGRLDAAAEQTARLEERLLTPVMFGGGTLAVVANPGPLVRSNDNRDRVVRAITALAPGNAVAFVEAAKSDPRAKRAPSQKRLSEAVKEAGGRLAPAFAPAPTGLGAWIETEAREQGVSLAPGAARELADRLGARVTEGDVERRHLTRIATMELDKLGLRHATDGGSITPDDVRALVAETTPASLWALGDAVGNRQRDKALAALDRLLDTTPEPVLLTVLHRRVVELLEIGDRLGAGESLPAAARAMGIASEFRARTLAGQARRWRTDELTEALAGLVELDAMVKGVKGSGADPMQRRLAFTLWVRDHTSPDR